MKERWKPGKIVYCQGRWRCRVVEDDGVRLAYVALEGAGSGYTEQTLNADRTLFTATREGRSWYRD